MARREAPPTQSVVPSTRPTNRAGSRVLTPRITATPQSAATKSTNAVATPAVVTSSEAISAVGQSAQYAVPMFPRAMNAVAEINKAALVTHTPVLDAIAARAMGSPRTRQRDLSFLTPSISDKGSNPDPNTTSEARSDSATARDSTSAIQPQVTGITAWSTLTELSARAPSPLDEVQFPPLPPPGVDIMTGNPARVRGKGRVATPGLSKIRGSPPVDKGRGKQRARSVTPLNDDGSIMTEAERDYYFAQIELVRLHEIDMEKIREEYLVFDKETQEREEEEADPFLAADIARALTFSKIVTHSGTGLSASNPQVLPAFSDAPSPASSTTSSRRHPVGASSAVKRRRVNEDGASSATASEVEEDQANELQGDPALISNAQQWSAGVWAAARGYPAFSDEVEQDEAGELRGDPAPMGDTQQGSDGASNEAWAAASEYPPLSVRIPETSPLQRARAAERYAAAATRVQASCSANAKAPITASAHAHFGPPHAASQFTAAVQPFRVAPPSARAQQQPAQVVGMTRVTRTMAQATPHHRAITATARNLAAQNVIDTPAAAQVPQGSNANAGALMYGTADGMPPTGFTVYVPPDQRPTVAGISQDNALRCLPPLMSDAWKRVVGPKAFVYAAGVTLTATNLRVVQTQLKAVLAGRINVPVDSFRLAPPAAESCDTRPQPFMWLLEGVPQPQLDTLLECRLLCGTDIAAFVFPWEPDMSDYLGLVSGFLFNVTPVEQQMVADSVRNTFLAHLPLRNFVMTHRDAFASHVPAQEVFESFCDSVSVSPIKFSGGEDTEYIGWRVYATSPTNIVAQHDRLRGIFAEMVFITAFAGVGRTRSTPMNCRVCQSIDHPTDLCSLQDIPGYCGPLLDPCGTEQGTAGASTSTSAPRGERGGGRSVPMEDAAGDVVVVSLKWTSTNLFDYYT